MNIPPFGGIYPYPPVTNVAVGAVLSYVNVIGSEAMFPLPAASVATQAPTLTTTVHCWFAVTVHLYPVLPIGTKLLPVQFPIVTSHNVKLVVGSLNVPVTVKLHPVE